MLRHYDAEYDSALRAFKGWWHGRHRAHNVQNRDGNLNVPYLYENGGKVVLNWNWLDNDWNGNNPALRHATRSFLLGFGWGVLFGQLPAPTAQISADFIEAYR